MFSKVHTARHAFLIKGITVNYLFPKCTYILCNLLRNICLLSADFLCSFTAVQTGKNKYLYGHLIYNLLASVIEACRRIFIPLEIKQHIILNTPLGIGKVLQKQRDLENVRFFVSLLLSYFKSINQIEKPPLFA